MSKKQIVVLILIVAVALFFAIRIIRNALTSEETKIKKLIKELAGEFEQKKFTKIFNHITDDYKDDGGNTKESLKEDAKLVLAFVYEIKVSISDLRIIVSKDKKSAEAGFFANVFVKTKFKDETIPQQMIFYLRREGGEWMLYKSNLEQYGEGF